MTGFREKPLHLPWFLTIQHLSKMNAIEAEALGLDASIANIIGVACSSFWFKRTQIAFNYLMDRCLANVIEAVVARARLTHCRKHVNHIGLVDTWRALGIDWSRVFSDPFLASVDRFVQLRMTSGVRSHQAFLVPCSGVQSYLMDLKHNGLQLGHSARIALVAFLETVALDVLVQIARNKMSDDRVTVEMLIEAIPKMQWVSALDPSTPLVFTEWVSMDAWRNPLSRLVVSMIRHDAK